MKKMYFKNKRGYTIIETMIAVSLFLVIIMAGVGALLNANLLHQKSQSMRSIMDSLSFIMEDIGRSLRTGYGYRCLVVGEDTLPTASMSTPKSCVSGWGIAFESANGVPGDNNDQWIYYIGTNGIDSNIRIFKSTAGPASLSNFIQMTPDEVAIDSNSFFSVLGAEPPPDARQPFVTIKLIGTITFKNVVTPFSLQTSVSQRLIDI